MHTYLERGRAGGCASANYLPIRQISAALCARPGFWFHGDPHVRALPNQSHPLKVHFDVYCKAAGIVMTAIILKAEQEGGMSI